MLHVCSEWDHRAAHSGWELFFCHAQQLSLRVHLERRSGCHCEYRRGCSKVENREHEGRARRSSWKDGLGITQTQYDPPSGDTQSQRVALEAMQRAEAEFEVNKKARMESQAHVVTKPTLAETLNAAASVVQESRTKATGAGSIALTGSTDQDKFEEVTVITGTLQIKIETDGRETRPSDPRSPKPSRISLNSTDDAEPSSRTARSSLVVGLIRTD